jgi:short-subunit dehydrogenase
MAATLITGASSGIGLELARVFARNRHDLVLVARTEPKLRELAAEAEASGVRADVIPADLSAPGAGRALADRVRALGVDVDILVNNAGYANFGPFVETPLDVELSMIQVNIVALTELTKALLPEMIARGHGRILNVASTAAFFPGPLMAVYYATKAYVLSFTEAIAVELAGTGVTVTALCPGPTASGFQAVAKLEKSRLIAGRRLPTARSVAEAGYAAMIAGKTVFVTGASNKLTVLAPRILPRHLMAKIVKKAQEQPR